MMMKKYRVMLEGRNFLVEMDGKIGRFGFYQIFFLEAASPAEAEAAAVRKVRGSPDLRAAARNAKNDPPMMYLEEIEEVPEFAKDTRPETGRGWYSEDEEKDASR
jgi:hypothetical protein